MSTINETLERLQKSFTADVAQNIYDLLTTTGMSGRNMPEKISQLIKDDGEVFEEYSQPDDDLDDIDSYNRIPSDRARRAILFFIEEILGFSEMQIKKDTMISHKINLDDEESDKSGKDETLLSRYYYVASKENQLLYRLVITHTFLRMERRYKRPNIKKAKNTLKATYQAYWLPIRVKVQTIADGRKKYVLAKYPTTKLTVNKQSGEVIPTPPTEFEMDEWKNCYQIGKQNLIELASNLKSVCILALNSSTKDLQRSLFDSWLFQIFIQYEKLIYQDIRVNILETDRDKRRKDLDYSEESGDLQRGQQENRERMDSEAEGSYKKSIAQSRTPTTIGKNETTKDKDKTSSEAKTPVKQTQAEPQKLEDLKGIRNKTPDQIELYNNYQESAKWITAYQKKVDTNLKQDVDALIAGASTTISDLDKKIKYIDTLEKSFTQCNEKLNEVLLANTPLQDTVLGKELKNMVDGHILIIEENLDNFDNFRASLEKKRTELEASQPNKTADKEKATKDKADNSDLTKEISDSLVEKNLDDNIKALTKIEKDIEKASKEETLDSIKNDVVKKQEEYEKLGIPAKITDFQSKGINFSDKNTQKIASLITKKDELTEKFKQILSVDIEARREALKKAKEESTSLNNLNKNSLMVQIEGFTWHGLNLSLDPLKTFKADFNAYAKNLIDSVFLLQLNNLKVLNSEYKTSIFTSSTIPDKAYVPKIRYGYNLINADEAPVEEDVRVKVLEQVFYQLRALYYISLNLTIDYSNANGGMPKFNPFTPNEVNKFIFPPSEDIMAYESDPLLVEYVGDDNDLAFKIDIAEDYKNYVPSILRSVYFLDIDAYGIHSTIKKDYDTIKNTALPSEPETPLKFSSLWLFPGAGFSTTIQTQYSESGSSSDFKLFCYCDKVGVMYIILSNQKKRKLSYTMNISQSIVEYFNGIDLKQVDDTMGEILVLLKCTLYPDRGDFRLSSTIENIRASRGKRAAADGFCEGYKRLMTILTQIETLYTYLVNILLDSEEYATKQVVPTLLINQDVFNVMSSTPGSTIIEGDFTKIEILMILRYIYRSYSRELNDTFNNLV
jgi:hypothetical protein